MPPADTRDTRVHVTESRYPFRPVHLNDAHEIVETCPDGNHPTRVWAVPMTWEFFVWSLGGPRDR